jgi:hypothetical protein
LGIFLFAARSEIARVFEGLDVMGVAALFLALGIVLTNPVLWLSLLGATRENLVPAAVALFCVLSLDAFAGSRDARRTLGAGVLLALYAPLYLLAWILGSVVLEKRRAPTRETLRGGAAVCLLGLAGLALPRLAVWAGGFRSVSSPLSYRSGLDGSTQYFTSILQAAWSPIFPGARPWSLALYVLHAAVLYLFLRMQVRELAGKAARQAVFLSMPYATTVILFPQYASIHPYFVDPLLAVPAAFLVGFWSLQEPVRRSLVGARFVVWALGALFVIMSNLLLLAQTLLAGK